VAGERAHLVPLIPRPVTPVWLERVRNALLLEEMSHRDLAKRVGCTHGTIQQLLGRNRPKSSRFVDRICKVLHLPAPGIDDEDKDMWLTLREELLREDPTFYRSLFSKAERRVYGRRSRTD
jgi:transcriptional regulator with XRE-family HTH domain